MSTDRWAGQGMDISTYAGPAMPGAPEHLAAETLFDVGIEQVAATTDDWYTPRWLFAAAGITFDLDIAAPVDPAYRTCPARSYLTAADDGLTAPWHGTVWMNPPYSNAAPWVARWAAHPDGLAIFPAMPEVAWRGALHKSADAVSIISLDFGRPDGRSIRLRWAILLAARGDSCVEALARVAAADKYAQGAYHVKPIRASQECGVRCDAYLGTDGHGPVGRTVPGHRPAGPGV